MKIRLKCLAKLANILKANVISLKYKFYLILLVLFPVLSAVAATHQQLTTCNAIKLHICTLITCYNIVNWQFYSVLRSSTRAEYRFLNSSA